jgi:hypothetical protein
MKLTQLGFIRKFRPKWFHQIAPRIEETKLTDGGGYECQVTTTNKTVLIVYLTVLGKATRFLAGKLAVTWSCLFAYLRTSKST